MQNHAHCNHRRSIFSLLAVDLRQEDMQHEHQVRILNTTMPRFSLCRSRGPAHHTKNAVSCAVPEATKAAYTVVYSALSIRTRCIETMSATLDSAKLCCWTTRVPPFADSFQPTIHLIALHSPSECPVRKSRRHDSVGIDEYFDSDS